MKFQRLFYLAVANMSLIFGMQTAVAGETCKDLTHSQSGELIADAFVRFSVGNTLVFNFDGSGGVGATIYDKDGMEKDYIGQGEFMTPYTTRSMSPRGDGLQLVRNHFVDLKALTTAIPAKCNFEGQDFSCIVGDYYCACYYGDPDDGAGKGCHCGSTGATNSCEVNGV